MCFYPNWSQKGAHLISAKSPHLLAQPPPPHGLSIPTSVPQNYVWAPQNFTCPKHAPNTHIHTFKPPPTTTFSGPRRKVCEKKAICQFTQARAHTHTYTQTTVWNTHKSTDWWKFCFLFVLADQYGGQYCVIEGLFCLKCLCLTIL